MATLLIPACGSSTFAQGSLFSSPAEERDLIKCAVCISPRKQSVGRRGLLWTGFKGNVLEQSRGCSRISKFRTSRGVRALSGFGVYSVAVENNVVTTTPLGLEVVEMMQPNSKVRLSVKVPQKLCKEMYEQVIKDLSKKSKVPGFRPGKPIPESVLINFVGPQKVKASVLEAVLKKTLPEAMSSVAGRAVKESEHILNKFTDLEASFSPQQSFSYDVAVDVAPEVKWTSERAYANLKVDVEIECDSAAEVAANAEFRMKLNDLGSLKIAESRGIKMEDVCIIDIAATRINADGSPGDRILSAEQKGFQLDTEEGTNFLPGFVEALLGLQREETRSFDLTFPETWQQEALRGIPARFTAHCKEIFIRDLPNVDESLAPKLLQSCTSIQQVQQELLKKHQENAEKIKKHATQLAITEALGMVAVFDVPNSLLEEQGRQMYAAKLIELQASAKLSKEQVIALSSEEMLKNFLLSQKEKITESVKQSIAIADVFKLEKLKYSEDELNAEVASAEEEFKRYNQEYDIDRIKEQAAELLEGSKVLDWLIEHAQVNYITKTV